jgi:hypothetical protein
MLFPQTWRQLCNPGSGVLRDPLGGCPNRARPVLSGGSAVNARPHAILAGGPITSQYVTGSCLRIRLQSPVACSTSAELGHLKRAVAGQCG